MNVEIINGISKKTNKEYECLKVSVGLWSKLLFVTPFELHYIKSMLNENDVIEDNGGIDEEIKKQIEVMFNDEK